MLWIFLGEGLKIKGKNEKKGANKIKHSFLSLTPIQYMKIREITFVLKT